MVVIFILGYLKDDNKVMGLYQLIWYEYQGERGGLAITNFETDIISPLISIFDPDIHFDIPEQKR